MPEILPFVQILKDLWVAERGRHHHSLDKGGRARSGIPGHEKHERQNGHAVEQLYGTSLCLWSSAADAASTSTIARTSSCRSKQRTSRCLIRRSGRSPIKRMMGSGDQLQERPNLGIETRPAGHPRDDRPIIQNRPRFFDQRLRLFRRRIQSFHTGCHLQLLQLLPKLRRQRIAQDLFVKVWGVELLILAHRELADHSSLVDPIHSQPTARDHDNNSVRNS